SPRCRWPTSSPTSSRSRRTSGCRRARAVPTRSRGGQGVERVVARLRPVLGPDAVITEHARLRTYECDGLAHYKVTPAAVVLPQTTEQVAAVVRACAEARVPFVARGSGTGLSGGALPHAEGVLVVTSRMRRILEVDLDSQRAV